jgi:antitoxin component YwqK of YwqJK toxin-antitoxin module
MQTEHIAYHADGSIHAKGTMVDGQPDGYWEWYRLDGTKMRSGYFTLGKKSGKWITWDKKGKPYKVTVVSK